MHRNDPRTVTLTSHEEVVYDWYNSLLNKGYGIVEAVTEIEESVPETSITYKTLQDTEFYYWLTGVNVNAD